MFFFRKLFGLFFLGFLLFGLLSFFGHIGQGRTQAAYEQGFMAGQQAAARSGETASAGDAGAVPAVPRNTPGAKVYYRGHGFFFPGFGFLFCLLPFFFVGLLFMAFGKRRWHGHHRRHGPCGRGPWKHRRGGQGEDWVDSAREKAPDDIDDGPDEPIMRA